MTFPFLILGVVLGGLACLVFLIFGIISLTQGKRNNSIVFSSLFLVSLIIVILSIYELGARVNEKVRNTIAKVKEKSSEWETRFEEERTSEQKEYKEWLKSIAPEEYRDTISESFFNSFDFDRNVYYIPLAYPYRVEMQDYYDEDGKLSSYLPGKKTSGMDQLEGITHLAFDQDLLLMKRDLTGNMQKSLEELPEVSYILLEFKTGKTETFLNKQQLMEEANRLGYKGNSELESLYDHYKKLN